MQQRTALQARAKLVPKSGPKIIRKPEQLRKYGYRPDAAWFAERLRARGLTEQEAAKSIDASINTLRRIWLSYDMSNAQQPTIYQALKLAPLLGVTLQELLTRLSYPIVRPQVPVVGELYQTGEVSPLPPAEHNFVDAPADDAIDYSAVIVRGSQPQFAMWDSWRLFFRTPLDLKDAKGRVRGLLPGAVGRLCYVQMLNHEHAMVGMLTTAGMDEPNTIRLFLSDRVRTGRVGFASPITWQKAG